MKSTLLYFGLLAAATSSAVADKCGAIGPNNRVECGWAGISADQCRSRGCCFDNSIPGVKWCFQETCAGDPKNRKECGWAGISAQQCKDRGCCFDNSVPGVKWCFSPESRDECAVLPNDRKECGWAGITVEQCESRGCCFDNRIPGVKWCFSPKKFEDACVVQPNDRKECGWAGITPEQCESRDCCFDSSISGVKWCFTPKRDDTKYTTARGTCAVDASDRVECGWAGITIDQCESRGCCFDNSIPGVKWCFQESCSSSEPCSGGNNACVGGFCEGCDENEVVIEGNCVSICDMKRNAGECSNKVTKYFYKAATEQCNPFDSCGNADGNSFATKDECTEACEPKPLPAECQLSKDPGNCNDKSRRYYYDTNARACKRFDYSGCGGNDNNFSTKEVCRAVCKKYA